MRPVKMKVCSHCRQDKPWTAYPIRATGRPHAACKACTLIRMRILRPAWMKRTGKRYFVPATQRRVHPVVDGLKKCAHCKVQKPIGDFYRNNVTGLIKTPCKICWNALMKKKYIDNKGPEQSKRMRDIRRRSTYGLEPEQFEQMLVEQNYRCKICQADNPKNLHIDHCHKTGVVRGILCGACNMGLGHFGDNLQNIEAAAKYLSKYSQLSVQKEPFDGSPG